MSSYDSADIFGSGPHRFEVGRQGQQVVENWRIGFSPPNGSTAQGLVELVVRVRGRLVGATDAELWARRDAVVAKLTDPPTVASLVDGFGRTWAGMSLVSYEELGPAGKGRVRSVGYVAEFRRFL